MCLSKDISRCMATRNYSSAMYLCSLLCEFDSSYILLKGIIYYEQGKYSNVINIFSSVGGKTALYYKGMSYKKLGVLDEAEVALCSSLGAEEEECFDPLFEQYILRKSDNMFICEKIGRVLSMAGKKKGALKYFRRAYDHLPMFVSMVSLMEEDALWVENETKWSGRVGMWCENSTGMDGVGAVESKNTPREHISNSLSRDSLSVKSKRKTDYTKKVLEVFVEFERDLFEFKSNGKQVLLEKYWRKFDTRGKYFISLAAQMIFDNGRIQEASTLFSGILKQNNYTTYNMDTYSTTLWHLRKKTELSKLVNILYNAHGHHYITYIALGNYFSLHEDHHRSIICFKRSLTLKKTAYAHTLLAHELVIRNEYQNAQKNFQASIKLQNINYNAMLGLATTYIHLNKPDHAEKCFEQGIKMNPTNFLPKLFYIKYLKERNKYNEVKDQITKIYKIKDPLEALKTNKISIDEEIIFLEYIDILRLKGQTAKAKEMLQHIKSKGEEYQSIKKKLIVENG